MSITGLDATTIANSLRARAGDGSVEWVTEPIQSSVLLDIADMLDENAKLRDGRNLMYKANVKKNREVLRLLEENAKLKQELESVGTAAYLYGRTDLADENAKLRNLVRHMHECMCNIDADGNYECDSCEYENTEGKCDFGRRMRELGVSDGTE